MSDEFLSIERANENNKDRILGVVSTKPGITLGFDDSSLVAGQTGYPLALTGRVPVRLSNENGNIAAGDMLTLSSVAGVAMKAQPGDVIVGRALESFNGTKAYTEGFINQFGDDIAEPDYSNVAKLTEKPTKADCYFGGGAEAGATSTEECNPEEVIEDMAEDDGPTAEEIAQAEYEAEQEALNKLRNKSAQSMTTTDGETVKVGQVIMFVTDGRYFSDEQVTVLNELLSTSTDLVLGAVEGSGETLWDRLKVLGQNFVDGVLKVAGVEADRVDTSELCVDDVCVTADDLRALLQAANNDGQVVEVTVETEEETGEPASDNDSGSDSASGDGDTNPGIETGSTTEPVVTEEEGVSSTTEAVAEDTEGSASSTEPVAEEGIDTASAEKEVTTEETIEESPTEEVVEETVVEEVTVEEVVEEIAPEPEPEVVEEVIEPAPEPEPTPEPAPETTE